MRPPGPRWPGRRAPGPRAGSYKTPEVHVLADDADFHPVFGVFDAAPSFPRPPAGGPGPDIQRLNQTVIQALMVKQQGILKMLSTWAGPGPRAPR